ncbi:MAG: flagellar hook-associated protein FlgL [Planctomycetota bacterium]|jgi:flagellar hook-associated protein 3 FlgL
MRSTMKIAGNTAIDNILDNYSRVMKLQNQMGTGRRVVKPSDDPLAANEGIRIQTMLTQIEQYQRNLNVGDSFLGLSDSALQGLNDAVSSAKSLTVGMANEATTSGARQASVMEIDALRRELLLLGNREVGGRYIFGGTETTEPPFQMIDSEYVLYTGNEEKIEVQVGKSQFESINVTAPEVFGSLITNHTSDQLAPRLNIDVDNGTRLEDLNLGTGVSSGSINITYSGSTVQGLEIDLSGADTLEDVIDTIQNATTNVITVSLNTAKDGIVLTDGGGGPITVQEVASNNVARDLGILGSVAAGLPLNGQVIQTQITDRTLLADIPGYNGHPLTITNGPDDPVDPALTESGDINNNLSNYALTGLTEGVNVDPNNRLHVRVTSNLGVQPFDIDIFKDAAMLPEDLVATGTSTNGASTVTINAANGSGISGTIDLNHVADGTSRIDVDFPDFYQGTINVEAFAESGDTLNQFENWQISGLERGVDTMPSGDMTVVVDNAEVNARHVKIYRDSTLNELVAYASLPAGGNGTLTFTGNTTADAFEPSNDDHSHITGATTEVQYLANTAGPNHISLAATFATVEDFRRAVEESGTYTTADITEDGRRLEINSRLAGAHLHVEDEVPPMDEGGTDVNDEIQRWSISGIKAGENADLDGKLYAEYTRTVGAPNTYTVQLFSDALHTNRVALGTANEPGVWPPVAPNELNIILSQDNDSGISGTVKVSDWTADNTTLELTPRDIGLSGKRREDNLFSTMKDVIDAGHQDDTGTLHDLIGNFETDNERVLNGRSEVGSRMERFEMMRFRLDDETTSFTNIFAERIDLDFSEAIVDFQTQTNIFNAALSVAGKIVPLSLVDFM